MRLVHQYLQESGHKYPDKIALICENRRLTYREVMARINGLADMFIVEGLQKGDRVMILLRDAVEGLLACLAVMRAGGIAVPVTDLDVASTIEELARECAPFMLITGKGELAEFPMLRDKLGCHFFLFNGVSSFLMGSPAAIDPKERFNASMNADRIIQLMNLKEDDGAILLYAPGMDGEQNGVLFSHRNVTQTSCNIDYCTKTDASTREFVLVPLTQSFGFVRICSLLFAGSTVILTNARKNPVVIAQGILKSECNALSSDRATLFSLVDEIQVLLKNVGSQLTSIHLGGAAVPFLVEKKKLMHVFPNARIYMHYGTIEAPCTTCIEFHRERKKLDSIGQPTPHTEISLIDDQGKRVGRGEIGEILVRGDQVMQQYWHRIELNRQVFFDGGWLRSGVVGYCDKDGYMHFLGRKNEIINTAGLKISPFEVEEAIHELYPDCDICVVGIPDPSVLVGEIPVLCYRSHGGRTIIPSELSSSLLYRLDKEKIPRIVYRIDHMPRTTDKIQRHELRKRILEGIAASAQNVI